MEFGKYLVEKKFCVKRSIDTQGVEEAIFDYIKKNVYKSYKDAGYTESKARELAQLDAGSCVLYNGIKDGVKVFVFSWDDLHIDKGFSGVKRMLQRKGFYIKCIK